MPASPERDDLLARIAIARDDPALALEYFVLAPDVDAVQIPVSALATRDPAARTQPTNAQRRLALRKIHPDAVAGTSWRSSKPADRRAWREVPASPGGDEPGSSAP